YVYNNPLRYIDPSGYYPDCLSDCFSMTVIGLAPPGVDIWGMWNLEGYYSQLDGWAYEEWYEGDGGGNDYDPTPSPGGGDPVDPPILEPVKPPDPNPPGDEPIDDKEPDPVDYLAQPCITCIPGTPNPQSSWLGNKWNNFSS